MKLEKLVFCRTCSKERHKLVELTGWQKVVHITKGHKVVVTKVRSQY